VQVHEDDIWLKVKRLADGLCSIGCLSDNSDCRLGRKQRAQTAAYEGMIVHE
jgi:hypothetical protein